jgi:hypothetical protein
LAAGLNTCGLSDLQTMTDNFEHGGFGHHPSYYPTSII